MDLTLHCWGAGRKHVFQSLSIYVDTACEDFTSCQGWTESPDAQSEWRRWGGDEQQRLKGKKKSKRGEGGDVYSLSSAIDVRSIVEGKGRREGAEKSIREKEAYRLPPSHIDGRRSRGERFLHCVKEVMRKWKEREIVGDRRGYVFDKI